MQMRQPPFGACNVVGCKIDLTLSPHGDLSDGSTKETHVHAEECQARGRACSAIARSHQGGSTEFEETESSESRIEGASSEHCIPAYQQPQYSLQTSMCDRAERNYPQHVGSRTGPYPGTPAVTHLAEPGTRLPSLRPIGSRPTLHRTLLKNV